MMAFWVHDGPVFYLCTNVRPSSIKSTQRDGIPSTMVATLVVSMVATEKAAAMLVATPVPVVVAALLTMVETMERDRTHLIEEGETTMLEIVQ